MSTSLMCALGGDIVSAEANSVKRYVSMSGTSTAAPMVSDAATLLIESNPALATDTQLLRQELLLQVDRSLNHETGNIDQNNLNYSRVGKGKLDIN